MRIAFAGGGTGGHLFPGVALAQEHDGASLFLCTTRPFDARQLSHYGFDHAPIDAPRLRDAVLNPMRMLRAVRQAAILLRAFRADVVVGVGGYGSAPALVAAKTLGIPYVLLEQNVRPGRTNRISAKGARRIYGQWRQTSPFFGSRFRHTGSPLRRDFTPVARPAARRKFALGEGAIVGIVGGSQGADSLNTLALEAWRSTGCRDVTFLHLAGAGAEQVAGTYSREGLAAKVLDFERDMGAFYSACDLVVSRAGGMAIAELASARAAAAFVPFPQAAEDHQRVNARALGDAAWLIEEPAPLAALVPKLVSADPCFNNRARMLARMARPTAARDILGDLGTWV